MPDDPVTDATDVVQDVIAEAHAAGEDTARWDALESRLQSLEAKGEIDLSPLTAQLEGHSRTVSERLDAFATQLTALESARTETAVQTPSIAPTLDVEPESITPQIDIKASHKTTVERAPKTSHWLFKRLGGNR